MDDYYFDSYGYVDENINEIIKSQQAFDAKYRFAFDKKAFVVGENTLTLTLVTIADNQPVADANITVKITRPDTAEFDKMLKIVSEEKGVYRFEKFPVEKIGRWQIMTKIITPDKLISFTKTEVNATK